jgi:DNA-binding NtrC family response regulator
VELEVLVVKFTTCDPTEAGDMSMASFQSTLTPDYHPRKQPATTILAVTPHAGDRVSLERILGSHCWRLVAASNLKEALACVKEHGVSVAICERDLPDGTWHALLEALAEIADRPKLIVCSRLADNVLWAEVLNLGGYDVLMAPFDQEEVLRVVSVAAGRGPSGSVLV